MAAPTFPLVNASFFVAEINIPNVSLAGGALEKLNSFIVKYEPECLINLLGYNLYSLFTTEDTARMGYLLNGKEFVNEYGQTVKWNGLKYNLGTDPTVIPVSLLANYIYFKYQESSATHMTGVATTVSKAEASINVPPAYKMVNAWEFFSKQSASLISFLWNYKEAGVRQFPEFDYRQGCLATAFSRPINEFDI